jgi:hypothetical protein
MNFKLLKWAGREFGCVRHRIQPRIQPTDHLPTEEDGQAKVLVERLVAYPFAERE